MHCVGKTTGRELCDKKLKLKQRQQQLVLYCWQRAERLPGFILLVPNCESAISKRDGLESLGLLLLSNHPLLVITRSLQLHPLIGSRQMAQFPAAVACFPPDLMGCVFVETHLPVAGLALSCCTLPDSISCVAKIRLIRLRISNCLSSFLLYH